MAKVKIELEPYNAITILSFCREFVSEESCREYKLKAILEAVNELQTELAKRLTEEDWEEIHATNEVNQLIGKSPVRKG